MLLDIMIRKQIETKKGHLDFYITDNTIDIETYNTRDSDYSIIVKGDIPHQ